MPSDRSKESEPRSRSRSSRSQEGETPSRPIPEFVRRALSVGFSGFFLTGEALREALGDSLPREWADFASEQSARARNEFIERLSFEMARAVESVDWAAVLTTLLEGRTLEVSATIRLAPKDDGGRPGLRVKIVD